MRKKLSDDQKKRKVTFSINEEINKLIDEQIEKDGIKKSHLIEKALKDWFNKNNQDI